MIFRPELAAQVIAGQKTMTRRPMSPNPRSPWSAEACALKVGRTYAVQPGRGVPAVARVKVTEVRSEQLRQVTDEDARREGFRSRHEFLGYWEEMYGRGPGLGQLVWVVAFELVR